MIRAALICLLPFAGPVMAETCPPVEDRSGELATLFNLANRARTELQARPIGLALWDIYTDAPDDRAQNLLDKGRDRLSVTDFDGAQTALDALVDYCPDYAEGYNQRAFVAYLQQDFDTALIDLNRALDRQPLHLPALSGKALTLFGLGRDAEGQRTLRQALKLNPWLSERALLEPLKDDTF